MITFAPSRGGIGIKLNIPKTRLIITPISKNVQPTECVGNKPILKIDAKMIASAKFAAGPARAVKNNPCRGFLKFRGFIGTGFAHPKITGECVRIRIAGKRTVPNGSA